MSVFKCISKHDVSRAGSFVGGILSDTYGRKWTINGSMLFILLGSLILLYNTYVGFVFVGLGIGPANNLSFVYVA